MKLVSGFVLALLVLAVGGAAVILLGLFPIGADNPPGAVEKALANATMDMYVDKHMPAGPNPVAVNPANLIEGARVYQENCAYCHGGSGNKLSPMRNHFSPPVPQILSHIPDDPDAHLFWVTKHGIRMTGMPAWGKILTDDQIWKVVTFIKNSDKLPPEALAAWQKMAPSSAPDAAAPVTPSPHP